MARWFCITCRIMSHQKQFCAELFCFFSVTWCVSPDRLLLQRWRTSQQLPAGIEPSKWRAGSWTVEECVCYPRSAASTEQCRSRTQKPLEEARRLLQELSESVAFWLSLRKHLTVAESIFILKILRDHSDWPRVKQTQDEVLRQEYQKLAAECRLFHPKWIHLDNYEPRRIELRRNSSPVSMLHKRQTCRRGSNGNDALCQHLAS